MAERHRINFTNKAVGDLDELSSGDYERLVKGCRRLESDPSADGKHVKKLKGYTDLYRLRIGDYRVVFQWKGGDVIIIRVLTRQDFGKKF